MEYGSGDVKGYVSEDKLCLSNSSDCTNDFKFILGMTQTGLDSLGCGGLIGLSLSDGLNDEGVNYDLFIDKMKANGAISNGVFSFSINPDTTA
jgi:hypothetical protein